MFGKGKRKMSSTDKFIVGKGIDAGNLKGRGKAEKTAPMATKTAITRLEFPDGRGPSKGKAGPVKIT